MEQVVVLGKGAIKAAANNAGSAIMNEARAQASAFSSSPSAAASAMAHGAEGLLGDAMGKAAEAQQALEGVVDDVGASVGAPGASDSLHETCMKPEGGRDRSLSAIPERIDEA
jgi:hypothetical protein